MFRVMTKVKNAQPAGLSAAANLLPSLVSKYYSYALDN
jgi:hypothetical protein